MSLLLALLVPSGDLAYREREGTVEDSRSFREWRSTSWREDFTRVVRDDAKKLHRGISREPAGFREVQSGAGYGRSSPIEAHVGLGAKPDPGYRVEVIFPATGSRAVLEDVKPGRKIVVKEPEK